MEIRKIYLKEKTLIVRIAAFFMRVKGNEVLATTIGDTINLYKIKPDNFIRNYGFLRHEMQHCIQYYNTKWFRLKYLLNSILGYNRNKYEIDAENNKFSKFPDGYVVISQKFILMNKDTRDFIFKGQTFPSVEEINVLLIESFKETPELIVK